MISGYISFLNVIACLIRGVALIILEVEHKYMVKKVKKEDHLNLRMLWGRCHNSRGYWGSSGENQHRCFNQPQQCSGSQKN